MSEIAKGNIVTALFIDLAKAFGTVDHSILLRRLHLMEYKGQNTNGLNHIHLTDTRLY